MKQIFTLLITLMAMATTAFAQSTVKLTEEFFPDQQFRDRLKYNYGLKEGDELTEEDLLDMTNISLYGSANDPITTLQGIEYFPNLNYLYVNTFSFSTVDLEKNTLLEYLYFSEGDLAAIDVSKNTELKTLSIESTRLANIDLSNNTKLTEVSLEENQFSSIDFSKNTELRILNLSQNPISSIDISPWPYLNMLFVAKTNIKSIDLSKSPRMLVLDVSKTGLSTIDISACQNLEELYIDDTNISSIDLSTCPHLNELNVSNTGITALDFSKTPYLHSLSMSNCNIQPLDLSNLKYFTNLAASNCGIKELDLSKFTIGNLDISHNKMEKLSISNNRIYDLHIEDNNFDEATMLLLANSLPNNGYAYISIGEGEGNKITDEFRTVLDKKVWRYYYKDESGNWQSYDYFEIPESPDDIRLTEEYFPDPITRRAVSNCVYVNEGDILYKEKLEGGRSLYIYGEQNQTVDLTGINYLKNLKTFYLFYSNISSIDISGFPELDILNIYESQLDNIDLSKNKKLTEIFIDDSNLSTIDVSNNPELTYLSLNSNKLTSLDLSKCTELTNLDIWDNKISTLDVSHIPNIYYLELGNNGMTSLKIGSNILIYCDILGNNLPKSDLNALFDALPDYSDIDPATDLSRKPWIFVDAPNANSGNEITASHIRKALAKNWNVSYWDAENEEEIPVTPEDYPEDVEDGIIDLTHTPAAKAPAYTLSGQRIQTKGYHGLVIRGGKKYLVK